MPEPVDAWWERRAHVTGRAVPYEVGTYREAWRRYPVLLRQYHPDLNRGVRLSQVPLSADVWLQWQCEVGHRFIATPEEQRMRPGGERRRSVWCPVCHEQALGKPARLVQREPPPKRTRRPPKPPCELTPVDLPPGEPFVSRCAPAPASAAEPALRAALADRLEFDGSFTAVKLRRPFFGHLEAWPDLLLPELRVAIEYDTAGRHGLEHTGARELADLRKDRLLRQVGWQVVRVRAGVLPPIGPHDVHAGGVTAALVDRLLDELREVRGPLLVDAYLIPADQRMQSPPR